MKSTVSALAALLLLSGCTANPYTGEPQASNTLIGAGIGATVGALTGVVIGTSTSASTRKAALIGAGIGALAGGGIGLYMDEQEARLRERLQHSGVSVTRIGNSIVLDMPDTITFDFGRAEIRPQSYDLLNSVAIVLNEFDRTIVDVAGHTDAIGSEEANLRLSEDRARAVADYLVAQRVMPQRLALQGFGKSQPIASNATPEGRARNRRVEIVVE